MRASPPPVVLVRETSTAIWQGDSGSASNGLGFGQVLQQNDYGGTSTGVRYSVKTTPGASFEVKCTPTATAIDSTPMGGPYLYASASISYTVEVGKVWIELTGGHASSPGSSYLIGQKCTAQVKSDFIGPLTVSSSSSWSVSGGDPFKQFFVDHKPADKLSQGYRENLTLPAVSSTFSCVFATKGDPIVTCTAALGVPQGAKPETGLSVELTAQTSTEDPVVSNLDKDSAFVRLSPSHTYLGVSQFSALPSPPPTEDKGLVWLAEVVTQEGYGGLGKWRWVQIVSMNRTRVVGGVTQTLKSGDDTVGWHTVGIDTSYPYMPNTPTDYWTAANGIKYAWDPPGEPLESAPTSYSLGDTFQTYLMYQPPGAGSEWVPLVRMNWSWSGAATKDGYGLWQLSDPQPPSPTFTSFPSFPNWSHYIFGGNVAWK